MCRSHMLCTDIECIIQSFLQNSLKELNLQFHKTYKTEVAYTYEYLISGDYMVQWRWWYHHVGPIDRARIHKLGTGEHVATINYIY